MGDPFLKARDAEQALGLGFLVYFLFGLAAMGEEKLANPPTRHIFVDVNGIVLVLRKVH
jgi:hypothetical protein